MIKNESGLDRVIRIIVGIILAIVSYVFLSGVWAIVGYIVALILVVTGLTGFCLLYKLFAINTADSSQSSSSESVPVAADEDQDMTEDNAESVTEASDNDNNEPVAESQLDDLVNEVEIEKELMSQSAPVQEPKTSESAMPEAEAVIDNEEDKRQ